MNSILKRLTNRSEGYVWQDLKDGRLFIPALATDAQNSLRELLGLNRRDTDFFVMGLLHTLTAYPELLAMLRADAVSYDSADYLPPAVAVIGGELVADPAGPPEILHVPGEWPPPTTLRLQRLSATEALFTAGTRSEIVTARYTSGKLRVSWPSFSGVRGLIELQRPWDEIQTVDFVGDPAAFPHAALAAALSESDATLDVLHSVGLTAAWVDTRHAAEKVAIATAALILSTPLNLA